MIWRVELETARPRVDDCQEWPDERTLRGKLRQGRKHKMTGSRKWSAHILTPCFKTDSQLTNNPWSYTDVSNLGYAAMCVCLKIRYPEIPWLIIIESFALHSSMAIIWHVLSVFLPTFSGTKAMYQTKDCVLVVASLIAASTPQPFSTLYSAGSPSSSCAGNENCEELPPSEQLTPNMCLQQWCVCVYIYIYTYSYIHMILICKTAQQYWLKHGKTW